MHRMHGVQHTMNVNPFPLQAFNMADVTTDIILKSGIYKARDRAHGRGSGRLPCVGDGQCGRLPTEMMFWGKERKKNLRGGAKKHRNTPKVREASHTIISCYNSRKIEKIHTSEKPKKSCVGPTSIW